MNSLLVCFLSLKSQLQTDGSFTWRASHKHTIKKILTVYNKVQSVGISSFPRKIKPKHRDNNEQEKRQF
jgi:hypothetical protein